MLAAILVQISRCATLALCPTDDELSAAVFRRRTEISAAQERAFRAKHPQDIVIRDRYLTGRVDETHCGEPSADAPATVTCSFTVTYPASVVYEVAKLKRAGSGWAIVDSLEVKCRARAPE